MAILSPERFADQFGDLLGARTFRLELLDFYVAPNEAEPYARFLAGEPHNPAWREPWKSLVRQARSAGKRMERVHVVTEPLTDYLCFELTRTYPASVEAGEDVRVLPRRLAAGLDLPGRDFWLFDTDLLAVMEYDSDGNWLSVDLTDDAAAIDRHAQGRDVALRHSVPLIRYLADLTTEEQHERRTA
jgi:hypothetical protein